MPSSSSSMSSWSDKDNRHKHNNNDNNSDDKEYDSDGNELYVVEEIRDKRKQFDTKTKRNVWVYHLKWKGYGDKDMTWEPIHNLDCPDLLQEFEIKWNKKHNKDRDSDRHSNRKDSNKKNRNKSFDSDTDLNKPSTSGLSKSDIREAEKKSKTDSSKKRKMTSDSDESDSSDNKRKKRLSKPGPKRAKEALLTKKASNTSTHKKSLDLDLDSDSDEDMKKKSIKEKCNSSSDSDSDAINRVKDIEKRILSKPGPKRAKEARMAKLMANESHKSIHNSDVGSDQTLNKPIDSDNYSKINEKNKKDNKDSEDEKTKKIMSKPGPKRAKEARLLRLSTPKKTPIKNEESNEKNKPIDSDSESQISEKTLKLTKNDDLDYQKRVILSKPGPKRAKEARIAKLNLTSSPKTTQIEVSFHNQETNEETNEKNKSDLHSFNDQKENNLSKCDSESNKSDESVENDNQSREEMARREKLLSKPGPKAAKEARIARLSGLNSTPKKPQNDCQTEDKTLDKSVNKECNQSIKYINNKSDSITTHVSAKLTLNSLNNHLEIDDNKSNSIAIQEDERRKILSKPGPKRAKEARLKKIDENLRNSSIVEEREKSDKNCSVQQKRTNSTDSLDVMISSTPAPKSIEMEHQLSAQISQNNNMTNGMDSADAEPVPDSQMSDSSPCPDMCEDVCEDMSGLAKIGNYVMIETTQYVDQITNALSIQNGGLDMEKPGFVKTILNIKTFTPNDSKNIEKIVSAFYNDNKLCFLIKWFGLNKCDVIEAQHFNK